MDVLAGEWEAEHGKRYERREKHMTTITFTAKELDDTSACTRRVVAALFPGMDVLSSPRIEGVVFNHLNTGSYWHHRFGGVLLAILDRKYHKVIRKVELRRESATSLSFTLDLDKVKAKFEELRVLAAGEQKVLHEATTRSEGIYKGVKALEDELALQNLGELQSRDGADYTLSLRHLSAKQVRRIVAAAREVVGA